MRISDKVVFHVLTEHHCDGQACNCAANLHLLATVLHVYPRESEEEPLALALDVEFAEEDIVPGDAALPLGVTCVTRYDYTTRQSHSPQATTVPPLSGSWTFDWKAA